MTSDNRFEDALSRAIFAAGSAKRKEASTTMDIYQAWQSFCSYMLNDSSDARAAEILREHLGPVIRQHLLDTMPDESLERERDINNHLVRWHLVLDLLDIGVKRQHVFECAARILEIENHEAAAGEKAIEHSYYKLQPIDVAKEIKRNKDPERVMARRKKKLATRGDSWDIPGVEYNPVRIDIDYLESNQDLHEFLEPNQSP